MEQYKPHERYFVAKALRKNPQYIQVDKAVQEFKDEVKDFIKNYDDQDYLNSKKNISKERHIRFIKERIRKVGHRVHRDFEEWLDAVDDDNIMFHLHITLALKLYDREGHFARFRLLWDKRYWAEW